MVTEVAEKPARDGSAVNRRIAEMNMVIQVYKLLYKGFVLLGSVSGIQQDRFTTGLFEVQVQQCTKCNMQRSEKNTKKGS